jgi:hypothetical protein
VKRQGSCKAFTAPEYTTQNMTSALVSLIWVELNADPPDLYDVLQVVLANIRFYSQSRLC